MKSKLKREDNATFRSNSRGSTRNGAHVDVGDNNATSSSTVSTKMPIGTFSVNQAPTSFNPNLINHINEVSPNQNMNDFNNVGLGDESVVIIMMPANLMADMNDTSTNTTTRNASCRLPSDIAGGDSDTSMNKLLEAHEESNDHLQALGPDNADFDSMSMIDCSACFSRGKQKVVCCHLFGRVCDQSF